MKSTNKKTASIEKEKDKEKEKENSLNLNESSDDENHDEENSSEGGDFPDKKDEKNLTNIFIYLTLITKLIKKDNGEYPCICHNLSKEDVIEENKNLSLNSQNTLANINNINNINSVNSINSPNVPTLSSFLEEEIIPNLEIPLTSDKKIFMKEIISKFKYLGYPTTGALFSVYIKTANEYVYFGSDPIDPNIYLDENLVDFDNIKIKMVSYIEDKLVKKTEKQLFDKKEPNKNQKDKRTKERKIEFIVEKVNAWRRLYNGFYNENGEYTRYSLDQAAKMVGISKKSLDDYLLQLRLGRKYGFNFNQNKTKKVGVLRAFVKKHRANNSIKSLLGNDKSNNDNILEGKMGLEEDIGEEENEQQGSNDSDDSDE
jgi:hypothetical protein